MSNEIYAIFPRHAAKAKPFTHSFGLDRQAIEHPVKEFVQEDDRIRRWTQVEEAGGRYLRVVLLSDQETVHNAFFDRSFKP